MVVIWTSGYVALAAHAFATDQLCVGCPQLVYTISEEHTPWAQAPFKCHLTIVTIFEGWVNLLCMCRGGVIARFFTAKVNLVVAGLIPSRPHRNLYDIPLIIAGSHLGLARFLI